MSIHWTDIEELARILLGSDENADADEIEQELYDEYEISFEQFVKLIRALVKFTPVVETAILRTKAQGFVHEGALIVKQDVE